MKISDGIRLGSAGKHQIKGQWCDNNNGVCAIGALMGIPNAGRIDADFPRLWEKIDDTFVNQDYKCLEKNVLTGIVSRNEAGWTFQQIIEWLESIGQ